MKRLLFALLTVGAAAQAQEIECPKQHAGAALTSGAIRVGPAEDRIELAGGDLRKMRGGYEIRYRFPGNEPKWLMCAYGKDGTAQRFEPMSVRATECTLRVHERGQVTVKMACR
jgi:hypothetical protein